MRRRSLLAIAVKLVTTCASDWRIAFAILRGCGVSIRLCHGQRYYIHAKLILVDGSSDYAGGSSN